MERNQQQRYRSQQQRPIRQNVGRPASGQYQQRRPHPQQQQQRGPPQQRQQQRRGPPQQRQQRAAYDPFAFWLKKKTQRFAKVVKVLSGDTMILDLIEKENPQNKQTKQVMVSLNGVQAPDVTRSPKDQRAELPFGFAARERTRQLVLGTFVVFDKLKEISDGKNFSVPFQIGSIAINKNNPESPPSADAQWTDLALLLTRQGWCTVKGYVFNQPNNEESESKQKQLDKRKDDLFTAEQYARQNHLGQHIARPESKEEVSAFIRQHTRFVDWSPNPQQLYNELKGQQIEAIVDQVRDGSTLKLELLLPKPKSNAMVYVHMTGIKCTPVPKPLETQKNEWKSRNNKGPFKEEKVQPLATEAKRYTERRLLGRKISVVLDTIGYQGKNIYGTIKFHKGDIHTLLLRNGLAEVVPWTAAVVGRGKEFNHHQAFAQGLHKDQKQKGRWLTNEVVRKKVILPVVTKVMSGDSIYIQMPESKEGPQRIYIASIKAPKMGNVRNGIPPEPWGEQSKEFVRDKLIGRQVRIVKEYTRSMQRGSDTITADFVSLQYHDHDGHQQVTKNLAIELVKLGLADVVPHAKTDTPVQNYHELCGLAAKAKEAKKGLHGEPPELPEFEDFYNQSDKYRLARAFCTNDLGITGIQTREERTRAYRTNRGKNSMENKQENAPRKGIQRLKGLVEFVSSPTRFKIKLLEHNKTIALNLAGVGCPRRSNRTNKETATEHELAIGQKAYAWAEKLLTQRVVTVIVESLDDYANFIGHVILQGRTSCNIAVELTERGWAKIKNEYAVDRSHFKNEIRQAESVAKQKREDATLWEGYETPEEEEPEEDEEEYVKAEKEEQESSPKRVRKEAPVRETMEGKKVNAVVTHVESGSVFYAVQQNAALKEVTSAMAAINPGTADVLEKAPERNDFVACLFGSQYYRAFIQATPGSGGKKKKDPSKEDTQKMYGVMFIDFGNKARVPITHMLQLDNKRLNPGLGRREAIEGLAVKCSLAGIKPPPAKMNQYTSLSGQKLCALSGHNHESPIELEILKEHRERTKRIPMGTMSRTVRIEPKHWRVVARNDGQSVNSAMLASGLARVDKKDEVFFTENKNDTHPMESALTKVQMKAINDHFGMWQYGNLGSDDEDDDGKRGRRR